LLTPYALIPVNDPQGFYQGQHWADADIAFAADRLLRLRYDVDFGARLSAAAKEAVRARLSPEVWFSHFPASLRRRILRSARRSETNPSPGH
jgi:hypothetical protein